MFFIQLAGFDKLSVILGHIYGSFGSFGSLDEISTSWV